MMTVVDKPLLMEQAVQFAVIASQIPEINWVQGDDLCDCTFQRIGDWTNPYIARTLRVRMCCIWNEIYKQYPQFVQEIPAFNDYRVATDVWDLEPWEWDGESDMPRDIWHRQLQTKTGMDLATIRMVYKGQEPPRGWYTPLQDEVLKSALDC